MSALEDLIPSLQRSVAVPGTFADVFPDSSEDDLIGMLGDSFAEAQLDGFFSTSELDIADGSVLPDLTAAGGALVVIYAGYRMLLNQIRNVKNHVLYEAGPVKFEQDQTASMLNELLRQLADQKKALVARAEQGELDTSGAYVSDLYFAKATSDYDYASDGLLLQHSYRAGNVGWMG